MSTTDKQKPTIEMTEGPTACKRFTHPAFGEISVMKSAGAGMELFGSSLNHKSVVTVRVSTAHLDRHLNRDWIFSNDQILSFHMSEAQWATFVSSQGGAGTPITFEVRPEDGAPLQACPGIESAESMRDTFHREIQTKCEQYMEQARQLTEALTAAAGSGKAGKGQLEELRKMAETLSVGLPSTMSFIQKQGEAAMEKVVAAGMIEIESFVSDLAKRTGLEVLRNQSVQLLNQEQQDD